MSTHEKNELWKKLHANFITEMNEFLMTHGDRIQSIIDDNESLLNMLKSESNAKILYYQYILPEIKQYNSIHMFINNKISNHKIINHAHKDLLVKYKNLVIGFLVKAFLYLGDCESNISLIDGF